MRLYSRLGVATVGSDTHGDFDVDPDGAVEVPHDFGVQLHTTFIAGQRAWEDDAERQTRLDAEDLARRRDPARLYDLVETKLGNDAGSDVQAQLRDIEQRLRADAEAAENRLRDELAAAQTQLADARTALAKAQSVPAKKTAAKKATPKVAE